MNCSPPGSSAHGDYPARILERVAFPSSRGSAQPWDRTQVSHITGRFFSNWATTEAKNTEEGSLPLLQQIFLTQESSKHLLYCKILYQLPYQGSPEWVLNRFNCVWFFETPWTVSPQAPCLSDSPGKNTAVGRHVPLQGIFPIQELNPCLYVSCIGKQILYQ